MNLNIKFFKHQTITLRKRILMILLSCSLLAIILTSLIAFKAIYDTRQTTLSIGNTIILQAAESSQKALTQRAKTALEQTALDKAKHMDENLGKIRKDVQILSNMMTQIASNSEQYHQRYISEPKFSDANKITAQLLFSSDVLNKTNSALTQEIGITANIQDFLIQINNTSDVIVSSYVASQNGFTIMVDRFADRKFQNSLTRPDVYDALSRPWYIQAKNANKLIFTDIVIDALGGTFTAASCRDRHGHQPEVFYQRLQKSLAQSPQHGHARCPWLHGVLCVECVCAFCHDRRSGQRGHGCCG